MLSVPSGWTAEERDLDRSIAHNLLVSWKKESTLGSRTFTIGVSTIGGSDVIGINPGSIGSPGIYHYFDESDYAQNLSWERGLSMPIGGLNMGLAEAELDNTSGRFLPYYMQGNSELFTSILPRRPFIINAGFNYDGIDQSIPQFAGVLKEVPEVSVRDRQVQLRGSDYVSYFQNRFLDQEVMFTALRTDEVLESLFLTLGMSTAQYSLDTGINIIPFGLFEKGTRFFDIIHQLVQSENGQLYQDAEGRFRFENRQHWDSSPYTDVQRIVLTSQVINAEAPNDDHLINVVEVETPIYRKQPLQTVFTMPLSDPLLIPGGDSVEQFFEFTDPVLQLTDPTVGGTDSFYFANSQPDSSGTDVSSDIQVTNLGTFAKAVKYRFTNTSSANAYLTQVNLSGRVARKVADLYYREQDDSSVTAYEERIYKIQNDYIQSEDWAKSYAGMVLADYSEVENVQKITIRALPELDLGDLISWQGRYWRIFDIKNKLNPDQGYVQELTILQRTIQSYFRIGISLIGGSDKIAP